MGSAVRQPQLRCHAQQKPERSSTAFFCSSHSERAASPTPSGSIRFVVEVLRSCVRACDGSAPLERNGSAEHVQTICPGKPQRKTPAIAFTHNSRGRVDPGRGRAFPDGHISGVMGFVCSSLGTVTWHHSCCQPDLVLAPVAAGAVHTSEQQEHAAVAIRRGAQDLSPRSEPTPGSGGAE